MMAFLQTPNIQEPSRLSASILNGNAIRDQIYGELNAEIASLAAAGIRPGLAAVLVGDNPASKLYVNSKIAACEKLGLASFLLTPPATITTDELLAVIDGLNRRDDVDGILVQMPCRRRSTRSAFSTPSHRKKTWTAFIRSTWASSSRAARAWLPAHPPALWRF